MTKAEFKKEKLEFHLQGRSIKGLSSEYILRAIFNDDIQKNWQPKLGDIIVGCTGNIYVISGIHDSAENLGGRKYFFGGMLCTSTNNGVLDSTMCFSANESGIYYHPLDGEKENLYHSSIRDYRYVPYPHEIVNKKDLLHYYTL